MGSLHTPNPFLLPISSRPLCEPLTAKRTLEYIEKFGTCVFGTCFWSDRRLFLRICNMIREKGIGILPCIFVFVEKTPFPWVTLYFCSDDTQHNDCALAGHDSLLSLLER